jgi:flagellar basal-body rod protein FlgB
MIKTVQRTVIAPGARIVNTLDTALRFQEQALKLAGQKQQMVASNIANSDTPNFKAQTFDFAHALERAQAGQSQAVVLSTSNVRHIPPSSATSVAATDVVYSTPSQPAADGNTVDMDHERAQFADGTLKYQEAFTFLNGQVKTILAAIQG